MTQRAQRTQRFTEQIGNRRPRTVARSRSPSSLLSLWPSVSSVPSVLKVPQKDQTPLRPAAGFDCASCEASRVDVERGPEGCQQRPAKARRVRRSTRRVRSSIAIIRSARAVTIGCVPFRVVSSLGGCWTRSRGCPRPFGRLLASRLADDEIGSNVMPRSTAGRSRGIAFVPEPRIRPPRRPVASFSVASEPRRPSQR